MGISHTHTIILENITPTVILGDITHYHPNRHIATLTPTGIYPHSNFTRTHTHTHAHTHTHTHTAPGPNIPPMYMPPNQLLPQQTSVATPQQPQQPQLFPQQPPPAPAPAPRQQPAAAQQTQTQQVTIPNEVGGLTGRVHCTLLVLLFAGYWPEKMVILIIICQVILLTHGNIC